MLVLYGQPKNKMKTVKKSKTIGVAIFLSVGTEQYFEVPVDYEIKGSSPLEAYQNLIDDFEDQNPNAIYRPEWVELGEYNCDFVGLSNEFQVFNNLTKENSEKSFDSEK